MTESSERKTAAQILLKAAGQLFASNETLLIELYRSTAERFDAPIEEEQPTLAQARTCAIEAMQKKNPESHFEENLEFAEKVGPRSIRINAVWILAWGVLLPAVWMITFWAWMIVNTAQWTVLRTIWVFGGGLALLPVLALMTLSIQAPLARPFFSALNRHLRLFQRMKGGS